MSYEYSRRPRIERKTTHEFFKAKKVLVKFHAGEREKRQEEFLLMKSTRSCVRMTSLSQNNFFLLEHSTLFCLIAGKTLGESECAKFECVVWLLKLLLTKILIWISEKRFSGSLWLYWPRVGVKKVNNRVKAQNTLSWMFVWHFFCRMSGSVLLIVFKYHGSGMVCKECIKQWLLLV